VALFMAAVSHNGAKFGTMPLHHEIADCWRNVTGTHGYPRVSRARSFIIHHFSFIIHARRKRAVQWIALWTRKRIDQAFARIKKPAVGVSDPTGRETPIGGNKGSV
jgi:hypothetical protein